MSLRSENTPTVIFSADSGFVSLLCQNVYEETVTLFANAAFTFAQGSVASASKPENAFLAPFHGVGPIVSNKLLQSYYALYEHLAAILARPEASLRYGSALLCDM